MQKHHRGFMYSQITNNIAVTVTPTYLDAQSSPEQNHYVWGYQVRITNKSNTPIKLKKRFWQITDSTGKTKSITGVGVVGEQPCIYPGDSFEYVSGAPLTTPSGFMVGKYEVETIINREKFYVEIPIFSLDSPHDYQTQLH